MINYFCNKETIEESAIIGISEIKDVDKICVFPDIHYCAEKSIPVGVSFSSTDKFFPLVTGKDVGCGVMFLRFPSKAWKKPFNKHIHYNAFNKASQLFTDEGLGGGNHFLSIEEGNDGNTYIICHTGTRNLGIYMYQQFLSLIEDFNYKHNLQGTSLPIELYTPELDKKYNDVLKSGETRRYQFVIQTLEFLTDNGYIGKTDFETVDSIHNVFRVNGNVSIHRKGATELNSVSNFYNGSTEVVIPISMTRGSIIAKAKPGIDLNDNLWSCAHGAGRKLSRTDTLKYWYSLKNKDKKSYEEKFVELLDRSGKFANGYLQEFDFAYKDSDSIMKDQPFLKEITTTTPIVTVKFTEI